MLNKLKEVIKRAGAGNSKLVYISLALIMIALPVFAFSSFSFVNFVNSAEPNDVASVDKNNFQEVSMELTYDGYNPNAIYVKKGIPVRWNIDVKEMTGCTSEIMIESLGIRKNLKVGENVIEFSAPADEDEIRFSCGMRMVWGKFIITEDGLPSKTTSANMTKNLPTSACNGNCGSSSCGAAKGGGCGCGSH